MFNVDGQTLSLPSYFCRLGSFDVELYSLDNLSFWYDSANRFHLKLFTDNHPMPLLIEMFKCTSLSCLEIIK